jgi:hypothetical protein
MTTAWKVIPSSQIFPFKSVYYGEMIKFENQLEKFDSFVQPAVVLSIYTYFYTLIESDKSQNSLQAKKNSNYSGIWYHLQHQTI